MLSRNTFFLSILFTSLHAVSAVNVGPLLAARQTSGAPGSQCDSQCSEALNLLQPGNCGITCLCSQSTMNSFNQCIQCTDAANIPPQINSVQNIENSCAAAGYPVTVGSTPSGTGSESDGLGGATTSPATATGALGDNSTTTAVGSQSTATGTTSGKSSATGLTARLGAVAAAVVGVVILAV